MAASPRWEGIGGRRREEGGGVVIARTNIILAGSKHKHNHWFGRHQHLSFLKTH